MATVVLVLSIVALSPFVWVAWHYWECAAPTDDLPTARRSFFVWMGKGVIAPVAVWILLNCGIFDAVPPLLAKGGAGRSMLLTTMPAVLFLVVTWWAVVSFTWLMADAFVRVPQEQRNDVVALIVIWSLLLCPLAAIIMYFGGKWLYSIGLLAWLVPLLHVTLPLTVSKKKPASYSRALAKIKFGKYSEAEAEVIRELEKYQDDFAGWMMLAELYANHFNDLQAAEQTISDLCDQPNVNPSQISVALHRLADWQLKIAEDPGRARLVLEQICKKFSGTHIDKMARLRIRQLPASKEELRERRQTKPISLPRYVEMPWDSLAVQAPVVDADGIAEAEKLAEKLKADPDDVSAREQFARTLTERLGKVDLGVEQLQLLLEMPEQPELKRAEWLSLIAAWHMRYSGNIEAARQTLERLVRDHPQTPHAFSAQRSLNLMHREPRIPG